jgi:D-amino acid aminotransferase
VERALLRVIRTIDGAQDRDAAGSEPVQVWIDDRLVDASAARISVFDRGFRTGEGVFETLRAYGEHPFRLDAHLDRAAAGAATLGFAFPDRERLREAVHRTAHANASSGHDLVLRLTVTPGAVDPSAPFPGSSDGEPLVVVTAQPLAIPPSTYEAGVAAALVPQVREVPEVKAVSYLSASLARREAQRRGAEEALLVDTDGAVREGSYSNVFAAVDGTLATPPLSAGILPGVTRAVVLELAAGLGMAVAERTLAVDEVVGADEVLLTATTREVVPVTSVDGRAVGDGRPGRFARELLATYREEVRREVAAAP